MSTLISVKIEPQGYWVGGLDSLRIDATMEELSQRNMGTFMGRSTQRGTIDFAFEVEDEVVGKTKAMLVVEKHFPGHKYQVEATPVVASRDFSAAAAPQKAPERSQRANHGLKPDFGMGM